ncbi:MAG: HAD family hydrolase [archaeon]
MIKAIIFDADNTLYTINTKNAYNELYRYLASHVKDTPSNITNRHKEIVESLKKGKDPKKRTYSHAISTLLKAYDKETKDTIDQALEIFWEKVIDDLEETPTSILSIIDLKDRYTLAIASDEFLPILQKKLKRIFGPWADSFSIFVTPEDTNTMKPSPLYYEMSLKKLKIKPDQAIVVGDSYERDIRPAKSCGIKTVLLSDTLEGDPDYHIKKMIELKKILEKP